MLSCYGAGENSARTSVHEGEPSSSTGVVRGPFVGLIFARWHHPVRRRVRRRSPPWRWTIRRLPRGGPGRGRTCCATPLRWTCWPVPAVAARMRVVATIEDPVVIRKILTYLGLPTDVPAPRPPPSDLFDWSRPRPPALSVAPPRAQGAAAGRVWRFAHARWPLQRGAEPSGERPGHPPRADYALGRYGAAAGG
jgi:hypothetical protein